LMVCVLHSERVRDPKFLLSNRRCKREAPVAALLCHDPTRGRWRMAGRRERESGSHQPATTHQGQAASICGDRRRSRPAPRHPRPMPSAEDRGAEGQGSRLRFRRLPRAPYSTSRPPATSRRSSSSTTRASSSCELARVGEIRHARTGELLWAQTSEQGLHRRCERDLVRAELPGVGAPRRRPPRKRLAVVIRSTPTSAIGPPLPAREICIVGERRRIFAFRLVSNAKWALRLRLPLELDLVGTTYYVFGLRFASSVGDSLNMVSLAS